MRGSVKWYDEVKGFGFITSSTGDDHFVHKSEIKNSCDALKKGKTVFFDSSNRKRGLTALQVHDEVSNDSRVNCPHCSKKVQPLPRYHNGVLRGSICPYCLKFVKEIDFSKERELFNKIIYGSISGLIIIVILLFCFIKSNE